HLLQGLLLLKVGPDARYNARQQSADEIFAVFESPVHCGWIRARRLRDRTHGESLLAPSAPAHNRRVQNASFQFGGRLPGHISSWSPPMLHGKHFFYNVDVTLLQ